MREQKSLIYNIARYIGLIILLIWAGFPIFFLFISSLKSPADIFSFPPDIIFRPTLINFQTLINQWPQFFRAIRHSIIITIIATLLTALLAVPAGYALSRFKGKIIKGSAFFMLAVRMYPPIILTIPLYPIFSDLGLVDTPWVLIILYSTFFISLSSWLMKTFIDEVPIEIEEAAEIDGANTFQKIIWIILPLSVQGIISSVIFVTIFAWKEFTFAYIFVGSRTRTAPIVLNQLQDSVAGVQWGPLFAASALQLIPILIMILSLQNYLIKGLSGGGLKG